MSILLGDIGGTRARLELRAQGDLIAHKVYSSQAYPSLISLLQTFLLDIGYVDDHLKPSILSLAIAGPISGEKQNQSVKVTNLSWSCNTHQLREQFNFKNVFLTNDLQAAAYGLAYLETKDFIQLHRGEVLKNAPKLLLGLGTGYGQSLLIEQNKKTLALAAEAGHMNYAPFNAFSHIFYDFLTQSSPNDYQPVSVESLLSGQGIIKLYDYLLEHSSILSSPEFSESMQKQKRPETISDYAHRHEVLAENVLEYYVELVGGQAANATLSCLPMGGLYLMGGTLRHIIPWLQSHYFMNAFVGKGCMSSLLKKIPIYVVTSDNVGLLGAGHIANH
jgi:glucokinase